MCVVVRLLSVWVLTLNLVDVVLHKGAPERDDDAQGENVNAKTPFAHSLSSLFPVIFVSVSQFCE